MELQFLKVDPKYSCMLSYQDSSVGIKTIVTKLPYSLQEKWTGRAIQYKMANNAVFPPFTALWTFLRRWAGWGLTLVSWLMVTWPTVLRSNRQTHSREGWTPRKLQCASKQIHGILKQCKPETLVCVIHKGPRVKYGVSDCRLFYWSSWTAKEDTTRTWNLFPMLLWDTQKSRL